ncbi:MAG: hypothetical protein LWX83_06585 [Anaerolineae bacterium]|nr:hypothetical protein [Anaerolineae bacterium]
MFDIQMMDRRIYRKPTLPEFGIIVFLITYVSYVVIFFKESAFDVGCLQDYQFYLNTASGDFNKYFYGYWLIPVFHLFSLLPFEAGAITWSILGIMGVWFAARVFNGNCIFALLSYQIFCTLFWGGMTGVFCGVLALFWWSLHKQKWVLAGIMLLVSIAKPQSAGIVAFFLWLFADISWKERIKVCFIPVIGIVFSFIHYPGWILNILSRSRDNHFLDRWGDISLYKWIGPFTYLLFLPVVPLHKNKQELFLALITSSFLAMPYFQLADTLIIMVFPIGIIPILIGYIPALSIQLIVEMGLSIGFLVPLSVYLHQIRSIYVEPFDK